MVFWVYHIRTSLTTFTFQEKTSFKNEMMSASFCSSHWYFPMTYHIFHSTLLFCLSVQSRSKILPLPGNFWFIPAAYFCKYRVYIDKVQKIAINKVNLDKITVLGHLISVCQVYLDFSTVYKRTKFCNMVEINLRSRNDE